MKLVCQQCNHENELERIYCHNCGTKLDRSKLPVEDPKAKKKKVRTGPSAASVFAQRFATFIFVLLGAAAFAAILCIFKPAPAKPDLSEAPDPPFFSTELEALAASTVPISRAYTETQINAYFKGKFSPRNTDGAMRATDAWVLLEPDTITVIGRNSFYGMPTGFEEVYKITPDSVPAKPELLSAKIGRLSIPASVAGPVIGFFSNPLYKRFKSEVDSIKKLGAKIEKEKITVFSGAPGA